MKISVAVNESGKIVAALIPPRYPLASDGDTPVVGLEPSVGETLVDLDFPDDDVPDEPKSDFLLTLQQQKDRSSAEATA